MFVRENLTPCEHSEGALAGASYDQRTEPNLLLRVAV